VNIQGGVCGSALLAARSKGRQGIVDLLLSAGAKDTMDIADRSDSEYQASSMGPR